VGWGRCIVKRRQRQKGKEATETECRKEEGYRITNALADRQQTCSSGRRLPTVNKDGLSIQRAAPTGPASLPKIPDAARKRTVAINSVEFSRSTSASNPNALIYFSALSSRNSRNTRSAVVKSGDSGTPGMTATHHGKILARSTRRKKRVAYVTRPLTGPSAAMAGSSMHAHRRATYSIEKTTTDTASSVSNTPPYVSPQRSQADPKHFDDVGTVDAISAATLTKMSASSANSTAESISPSTAT